MNLFRFKITVLLCWVVLSCNSHKEIQPGADSIEVQKGKIIRYHEDSVISHKNKVAYMRNMAKNLGLPVLIGGFQGLYVRLWSWDSTGDKYVIDIRRTRSDSSCTITCYSGKNHDTVSYLYICDKNNVTPQSGWTAFFNCLEKFSIPKMPIDNISKEEKSDFTDLHYLLFEVDQPYQYRYLEYPDPVYFIKEDSTSANLYAFLKYFNKEMKTHIYNVEKYRSDSSRDN